MKHLNYLKKKPIYNIKNKKKYYYLSSPQEYSKKFLRINKNKSNIIIGLEPDKNIFNNKKMDQVFNLIHFDMKMKSNSQIVEIKISEDLYETLLRKQLLNTKVSEAVTNSSSEVTNSADLVLQSSVFLSNSLFETSITLAVLLTFVILGSSLMWYLPPVDF